MSSTALSSEVNSGDPANRVRELLYGYLAGSRLFHHFSDIAVVNADSSHDDNQRHVVNDVVNLIVLTEDKETRDVCLKQLISCVLQQYSEVPSSSGGETSGNSGQGVEIEELVRNILLALHRRDPHNFPLKFLCDALVSITDFKLGPGTKLDGIKTVRKFLPSLDYKGVRDLLKAILDKMLFLPQRLAPVQRENLTEIEELVMEIVDREKNHLPAYFVMNELYRLNQTSQQHRCFLVSELADKFSQVLASFRPLSDLVTIIGRPYMIPVAGHGGFINNSSWKLDHMLRLTSKGYLPYCQEYVFPQRYLLYQLFRQPRGRELVNGYLLGRQQAVERPRVSPLSDFVSLVVLEAMMEAETGKKDAQAKAYEWLYIINTFVFSLIHQGLNFQVVVQDLKTKLSVLPYRKARDDLMWVLLQYVSGGIQKFTVEDCTTVLELYKLFYTGKEEFTTNHDEPDFVRKMAPTCLWVHLVKRLAAISGKDDWGVSIPATIDQQMKFLEDALSKRDKRQENDFLSAVLCNAFSTKTDVVEKQLMPSLVAQWESHDSFKLPLGGMAARMFRPLTLQFLDALTIHFRMHLMTSFKNLLLRPDTGLLPSPAAVESFVRLVVASEADFGLKNLLTQILPDAVRLKRNDMLHLLCEIVSYRVPICAIPFFIRIHTVLTIYQALNAPQIHPQLFWLLENTFIRQLLWLQSGDCFSLLGRLFANVLAGADGTQQRPQVMTFPSEECSRISILTYARAIRVLGSDVSSEYVNRLGVHNWPSTTLKLFPASLSSIFQSQGIPQHVEERQIVHSQAEDEYIKWRTLGSEESLIDYFTRPDAYPVFLRLLWRVIHDGQHHIPGFAYKILEAMPPKLVVKNIYKLVDFLVERYFSHNIDVSTNKKVLSALDDMIWKYWLIPFERVILACVMMHYERHEANGALGLVHYILKHSTEFADRIKYLTANMPSNPWTSTDSFEILAEYYKKFPLQYWSNPGLPVYFGHIAHRFIPVSDLVLQKVIEIPEIADSLFEPILEKLAPIYKFHPQPALFLCSTLYLCEAPLSERPDRRRKLVLRINEALDGCRPPGWLLTDTFRSVYREESVGWEPTCEYYEELVRKVTEGMDSPLDLPSWAEQDWRFAEFPNPASQALHAVLIEIMILPVQQVAASQSLIKLFLDTGWSGWKRKNTIKHLNSLAVILTVLLPVYHGPVYAEAESAVVSPALTLSGIEGCLFSFERSSHLMQESRPLRVLALMHAFWHHAPIGLLAKLPEFFRDRIVPVVKTEAQLMFAYRMVVPFLQRLYSERTKCVMEVAKDIYEVLLQVDQNCQALEFEDTYSDLLYHLKYMFVGDGIKPHIDRIIPQLRPSLQEKLKFISHQQQTEAASAEQQ